MISLNFPQINTYHLYIVTVVIIENYPIVAGYSKGSRWKGEAHR